MPFEADYITPRRIAVVGGGISGMGAAHLLADHHHVTLFEAEPRLGGHARTIIAGKNGDQPVDTGFIVFNYVNYPHLTALFERLAVPVTESDMSFGASLKGGAFEYGLADLNALFAQKKNALRPAFLGMIRDILRFNNNALHVASTHPEFTIGEFLAHLRLGEWFKNYYLLPLSGAIWSTPVEKILDFPAHAMIRFFENHALLSHTGQHQWFTVEGGSIEYVKRLKASLETQGVSLRLGAPVEGVRRPAKGGAEVRVHGGEWEAFDEVVIAAHSDDALRLLADPTPAEKANLGAIRYQPNDIVLHADEAIMPRSRKVWSSWNYVETNGKVSDRIDLTYWMNRLQPIPKSDPMFVTLNSTRRIREDLIYDQTTLRHPVYDLGALAAQSRINATNGTNNTWFCGAWMRHGFHEDGLHCAVEVARALRRSDIRIAAE